MRLSTVDHEFVEFIPSTLTEGRIYVTLTYATAVHLCACGCGTKVVTPISPAEWQLSFDGESISLTPSIGNWEFPCRSHYWIRSNKIRWAAAWTDEQIEAGQRRDAEDLADYFASRRSAPEEHASQAPITTATQHRSSVIARAWHKLIRR